MHPFSGGNKTQKLEAFAKLAIAKLWHDCKGPGLSTIVKLLNKIVNDSLIARTLGELFHCVSFSFFCHSLECCLSSLAQYTGKSSLRQEWRWTRCSSKQRWRGLSSWRLERAKNGRRWRQRRTNWKGIKRRWSSLWMRCVYVCWYMYNLIECDILLHFSISTSLSPTNTNTLRRIHFALHLAIWYTHTQTHTLSLRLVIGWCRAGCRGNEYRWSSSYLEETLTWRCWRWRGRRCDWSDANGYHENDWHDRGEDASCRRD